MPLLGLILPIISGLLDKLIPDPAARAKEMSNLVDQIMKLDSAQLEVNKAEAGSSSPFVAGWRPFIGWVCGAALAYTYIVVPLGMWIAAWAGVHVPPPPILDGNLWELMLGMLGLGTLRTIEKVKGIVGK